MSTKDGPSGFFMGPLRRGPLRSGLRAAPALPLGTLLAEAVRAVHCGGFASPSAWMYASLKAFLEKEVHGWPQETLTVPPN